MRLTRYVEDDEATVPEQVTEQHAWTSDLALLLSDAAADRGDWESSLGWLEVANAVIY